MKEFSDDKLMRDILKKSYVELTDPEFDSATLRRIVRESRKRRIVNNLLVNLLAFIAIDSIIWLSMHLTGMDVFDLTNRTLILLDGILLRAGEVKETVAGNHLTPYLVLAIGGIAALLAVLESRLGSSKNTGH